MSTQDHMESPAPVEEILGWTWGPLCQRWFSPDGRYEYDRAGAEELGDWLLNGPIGVDQWRLFPQASGYCVEFRPFGPDGMQPYRYVYGETIRDALAEAVRSVAEVPA